ncbi:MAG: CAP domain-containing protein [Actinobacteria bacterium]|nr:CAP domain-containing protein [Actinomycetota bacterium]
MAVLRTRRGPASGVDLGRGLLDRVPTQRAPVETAPPAVRRPGRRGVALVAVLAMLCGGAAAELADRLWLGADAQAATRVSAAAAAAAGDGSLAATGLTATALDAAASEQGRAVSAATQAAQAASAALDSSPHAGDVPRAQLEAAAGALTNGLGSRASASDLQAGSAAVATATAQVVAAEAAWQAAEASAAAAAEQAAAAQAASARASGSQGTAVRSGQGAAQDAGAAPSASAIGAGGKQCTSAGSGAASVAGGDVAAQINEYRISNGLPALSVSDSPTLMSHALLMADAGGIWHSGADNIVGCVSNNSAKSLVIAWSRSAPHNAQMLRTDVSAMTVGSATLGGWLYGAVRFS